MTRSVSALGSLVGRLSWAPFSTWSKYRWEWVKKRYSKWNPVKWKHGQKPAVPWCFNVDPYPDNSHVLGAPYFASVGFPGSVDSTRTTAWLVKVGLAPFWCFNDCCIRVTKQQGLALPASGCKDLFRNLCNFMFVAGRVAQNVRSEQQNNTSQCLR